MRLNSPMGAMMARYVVKCPSAIAENMGRIVGTGG
jgi:hypothetical protein